MFKPGDVVQVKSGGPKMTVDVVIKDGEVTCVWFDDQGNLLRDYFRTITLQNCKEISGFNLTDDD